MGRALLLGMCAIEARDTARRRVLVVDDDAVCCGALELRLDGEGFEVELATSAEQALARIAARPSDVLLSDIRMPGMDGLELLRRVRAAGSVPVIMMSAEGASDTVLAAGAVGYVMKPLDIDDVVRAIEGAVPARGPR